MQIGEFAKICRTKISVLRHYDRLGLLTPSYTDPFTGYRYYSAGQIGTFRRIHALKQAGFSLGEIREIQRTSDDDQEILRLFERKRTELTETLNNLELARNMMLEGDYMNNVFFTETGGGIFAKAVSDEGFGETCTMLEEAIGAGNYQRISGFRPVASGEKGVVCQVIRLADGNLPLPAENSIITFENDETIVGKWQIIGQYAVKEDFFTDCGGLKQGDWYGGRIRELYFLPGGEPYWIYRWTKGKLILKNGDGTTVNSYETEEHDGVRYMFVQWKSYHYRRGGQPVVLVLRQADHKAYTKDEIRRRDNVNLPFEEDERIPGVWMAHSTFRERCRFNPMEADDSHFWKEIRFSENGQCRCVYGDREVSQTWTRGFILDHNQHTASAYELVRYGGNEYLIAEWKNGDYIYGGYLPGYCAFVKVK